MAKLVDDTEKSIEECALYLKSGGLVAFPTETVYGLGGALFNEHAIEHIYKAKRRPKTDPLIVHVKSDSDAKSLLRLNSFQEKCFELLAREFWPGPLTIVAPASSQAPKTVMGGGEFIGIRVPAHPVSQKFLSLCDTPVVAPSANLFGHVSPTSAYHVFSDLKSVNNLLILNTQINCAVGIESTVVKLEYENALTVLRLGKIGTDEIKKLILKSNLSFKINVKKNFYTQLNPENVSRETFLEDQNVSRETFLKDSPGQNLTHYSPWIPTYIFVYKPETCKDFLSENKNVQRFQGCLQKSVFIDFKNQHDNLKDHVLKYYDLSQKGDINESLFSLFGILREAEEVKNAEQILIARIPLESSVHEALFDRIYRAASGKFVY